MTSGLKEFSYWFKLSILSNCSQNLQHFFTLRRFSEEKTIVCFEIDSDGSFIPLNWRLCLSITPSTFEQQHLSHILQIVFLLIFSPYSTLNVDAVSEANQLLCHWWSQIKSNVPCLYVCYSCNVPPIHWWSEACIYRENNLLIVLFKRKFLSNFS